MCHIVFKSLVILVIANSIYYVASSNPSDLTVTILHTNDVHARFRQIGKSGGSCSEADEKANKCYGGFARLRHKV